MVVTLIITMSVSIYCCGKLAQKYSKTLGSHAERLLAIHRPRTIYREPRQPMLTAKGVLGAMGKNKRKTRLATTK